MDGIPGGVAMSTWIHTKTEVIKTVVTQIVLNFLEYNERFRQIRKEIKVCGLCEVKFVNGQLMNIAFTSRGNKLICKECADRAIDHGVPAHEPKLKEE